jgi:predicted Zn-dependent peptidase
MPEKRVLDNGVILLVDEIPTSRALSIGLWIDLGSRDERDDESGFAHVLEHMLFKGTRRRSAFDIACQIDSFGGEINGSTGKENTYYFVDVAAEHWQESLDILFDMYFNSSFKVDEFQREQQVILDEINMAIDDPEDYVGDLFSRALWGDLPLGRPVLGNRERVASMSRSEALRFYREHYRRRGLIVSVAGRIDARSLTAEIERQFRKRGYKNGSGALRGPRARPKSHTARCVEVRDITQVHVICGVEGFGSGDDGRFPLMLLNIILGSSISSRLFQSIREEKGLCYSIASNTVQYSDAGEFNIGFSTSRENLPRVLEEVDRELVSLVRGNVRKEELDLAKEKVRGSFILGAENIEWKMIRMAMQEMLYGELIPYDETLRRIAMVELDDVERVAHELLVERQFSMASIGPPGHDAFIRQLRFSLPHRK